MRRHFLLVALVPYVGLLVNGGTRVAAAVPALAFNTVLEGSTSGMVTVDMPVPSYMNSRYSSVPDYPQVTGKGRLAGFILSQAGAAPDDPNAAGAYGLLNNVCPSPGCAPYKSQFGIRYAFGPDLTCRDVIATVCLLPAGEYDLYLIADGAPVQVSLTFHGLTGSTTLTSWAPSGAQIDAPANRIPYPASETALSAGSNGDLGARGGFLWTQMVHMLNTGATIANTDFCLYEGGNYDSSILPYTPGCLDGADRWTNMGGGGPFVTALGLFPAGEVATAGGFNLMPLNGVVGVGWSTEATGVAEVSGVVSLWQPL